MSTVSISSMSAPSCCSSFSGRTDDASRFRDLGSTLVGIVSIYGCASWCRRLLSGLDADTAGRKDLSNALIGTVSKSGYTSRVNELTSCPSEYREGLDLSDLQAKLDSVSDCISIP